MKKGEEDQNFKKNKKGEKKNLEFSALGMFFYQVSIFFFKKTMH